MLNENIRTIRKAKGLSQEELAGSLHVVRQTVSKWETGLSVPDSDLLILLSKVLETPVSTLLGESVPEAPREDAISRLSEKLEEINGLLAQKKEKRRKALRWSLFLFALAVLAVLIALYFLQSPYLYWDYEDGETAVFGAVFHVLEWTFMRLWPVMLAGAALGLFLTRKRR